MKLLRVFLPLSLLAGLLAAACQNPASDGDALDFFDRRAKLICKKNFQCCMGGDLLSGSESSCVASNNINSYADRLRSSLDRGTAHLDTSAANACFAAIDKLTCEEWALVIRGADPEPCQRIISGSRKVGDGCSQDYDCASLFCDKAPESADGTCATKGSSGAPCSIGTSSCVDGVSCLDDGTGATLCTTRKLAGSSCTRAFECSSAYCKGGSCRPECWAEVLSHELFGI